MDFFRSHQYARIQWYPQISQVGIWQAERKLKNHPTPDKCYVNPNSKNNEIEGLLLLIVGNLDNLDELPERTKPLLAWIQKKKDEKKESEESEKSNEKSSGKKESAKE